jgi:hypothetical protein
MTSARSKMGKVETSLLRVLQCIRNTDSPGLVPAVPGAVAGRKLHVPPGHTVHNE